MNRWTSEAAAAERLQHWIDAHPAATDEDRRIIDADLLPGGHLASSDDDPRGRRADEEAARVENGWLRAAGWAS